MPESQNGQYGYDRPWQSNPENIATQRIYQNAGPSWFPDVPPSPFPQDMVPPRFGWRTTELGIDDILNGVFTRLQGSQITATESDDWSGVQGGYQGTMRPTGAGGGGVT